MCQGQSIICEKACEFLIRNSPNWGRSGTSRQQSVFVSNKYYEERKAIVAWRGSSATTLKLAGQNSPSTAPAIYYIYSPGKVKRPQGGVMFRGSFSAKDTHNDSLTGNKRMYDRVTFDTSKQFESGLLGTRGVGREDGQECQHELAYMMFVDLVKAFDSAKNARNVQVSQTQQYEQFGNFSSISKIESTFGVKQGDNLGPTVLFIFLMNAAAETLDKK
eukprot:scaffold3974_cov140-Cylindrotheca_fusiformis.AAC.8